MWAVSLTDFSKDNLSALVVGCLAVAGGFVGGMVLGMLAAKGFDRFLVRTESPKGLHKVLRYTGGLIVAILVALMVFHGGGGGDGGPGAGGGPTPGDHPNNGGAQTTAPGPDAPIAPTPVPIPPKIQIDDAVIVTVYGGADVEAGTQKYFQVDRETLEGNRVMVELGGVKARVQAKLKTAKKSVVVVYEYAPTASENTAGGLLLRGAKDSLGASLMSQAEYQQLLAKQP